jgi:hypothetical protein
VPPVELRAVVVRAVGERVWLRRLGDVMAAPLPAVGELFTGSNGAHCPAGLWIGRCEADPQDLNQLIVALPPLQGAATVRWCTGDRRP